MTAQIALHTNTPAVKSNLSDFAIFLDVATDASVSFRPEVFAMDTDRPSTGAYVAAVICFAALFAGCVALIGFWLYRIYHSPVTL